MIDSYIPELPNLPYELIGKAVVVVALVVFALVVLVAAIITVLFIWCRGWARLSNYMYKGYDPTSKEERPPVWKMRIAGVSLALSRFKFRKIPAAYREVEDLTENEDTFRDYLSEVFVK